MTKGRYPIGEIKYYPPKSVYDLELHEATVVDDYTHAVRVPGGWIYQFQKPTGIVFVPYQGRPVEKFKP